MYLKKDILANKKKMEKSKASDEKEIRAIIEIPEKFSRYLNFLENALNIDKKEYLEQIIKEEIKSRLFDLKALIERS